MSGMTDAQIIAVIEEACRNAAGDEMSDASEPYGCEVDCGMLRRIAARLRGDGEQGQAVALDFDALRKANVARCEKWHPAGIESWSPSDWMVAVAGEVGELAGEVKMHNRDRDGLAGNKEQISDDERLRRMGNEAADVVIYLDLFCAERGIDLGASIVRKFNEVSVRVGFPDRLNVAALSTQPAPSAPVVAPIGWEPCTPDYVAKNGDCATAPRVSFEGDDRSHYHPTKRDAEQVAASVAVPEGMLERLDTQIEQGCATFLLLREECAWLRSVLASAPVAPEREVGRG